MALFMSPPNMLHKAIHLAVLFLIVFTASSFAQSLGTLGNYSDSFTATAGGNATVSPDAAPTGDASVTAYTTTDFKGLLASNQQPLSSHSILIRSYYEL